MNYHDDMFGEALRQVGLTDSHLQLVGRVIVIASLVEASVCNQIVYLEGRDYAEWQAIIQDPISKKLKTIRDRVERLDAAPAFKTSFCNAIDTLGVTFKTRHDLVHGVFFPAAMFGLPDVAPFVMRPPTPEHTLGRPAQFDKSELHALCDGLAEHCGELERHVAAVKVVRGQARSDYGGEAVRQLVRMFKAT